MCVCLCCFSCFCHAFETRGLSISRYIGGGLQFPGSSFVLGYIVTRGYRIRRPQQSATTSSGGTLCMMRVGVEVGIRPSKPGGGMAGHVQFCVVASKIPRPLDSSGSESGSSRRGRTNRIYHGQPEHN